MRMRGEKMPIVRYIAFVGSLLVAIMFFADWYLTMAPTQSVTSPEADKPIIRIKSDRKWPERIVFDTSAPTIVPQKSPGGMRREPATPQSVHNSTLRPDHDMGTIKSG